MGRSLLSVGIGRSKSDRAETTPRDLRERTSDLKDREGVVYYLI